MTYFRPRKSWYAFCLLIRDILFNRDHVMHKKTLFSRAGRLAVAVSGALALAGAALPANASTLRIAMTAADIP